MYILTLTYLCLYVLFSLPILVCTCVLICNLLCTYIHKGYTHCRIDIFFFFDHVFLICRIVFSQSEGISIVMLGCSCNHVETRLPLPDRQPVLAVNDTTQTSHRRGQLPLKHVQHRPPWCSPNANKNTNWYSGRVPPWMAKHT